MTNEDYVNIVLKMPVIDDNESFCDKRAHSIDFSFGVDVVAYLAIVSEYQ